jgi:hypothetical protein
VEVGNRVRVILWKGKPDAKVVVTDGEIIEIYDDSENVNEERYRLHVVETKDQEGNRIGCGTYFQYEVELLAELESDLLYSLRNINEGDPGAGQATRVRGNGRLMKLEDLGLIEWRDAWYRTDAGNHILA